MRKIGMALTLSLLLGLIVGSCNESKSEKKSEVNEIEKNDVVGDKNKADTTDHGYEMAMAAYQCPMKCEGDKVYDEEGTCPKCKMDLKQIDETKEDSPVTHEHHE